MSKVYLVIIESLISSNRRILQGFYNEEDARNYVEEMNQLPGAGEYFLYRTEGVGLK